MKLTSFLAGAGETPIVETVITGIGCFQMLVITGFPPVSEDDS